MADEMISDDIEALVKEEHELLDRGGRERGLDDAGHARPRADTPSSTATGICCASGERGGA